MSNLKQLYGTGFPISAGLGMPWMGEVQTGSDGSQWYSNTTMAPFAYTSAYSYLPESMTSPHPLFPGPESGGSWCPGSTYQNIAWNPSGNVFVTAAYYGSTQNSVGYIYYRSTNDGVSWTQYTLPNGGQYYACMQYTGGKFIGVATSSLTNGIITSTDGITWTTITVSGSSVIGLCNDVVSNGSTNFIAIGPEAVCYYSTDSAATWTSVSMPTNPLNVQVQGAGVVTWNAGAGLFICGATTAGYYMTSPTGATWTAVNNSTEYVIQSGRFTAQTRFASNANTTVAVGQSTAVMTSTNGTTWTYQGLAANLYGGGTYPHNVYYDGTRFVIRIANRVWYSTTGASGSWTEGKKIGGSTIIIPSSNGCLFNFALLTAGGSTKCIAVKNVTLTTPQTIISGVLPVATSTSMTHYRIR